MDQKTMEHLKTKKLVPPNPECRKCFGKHVNQVQRALDACPDCWPEGAKIHVPQAKPAASATVGKKEKVGEGDQPKKAESPADANKKPE